MRKRVANEDLSDMELKKQPVKWYNHFVSMLGGNWI